MNKLKNSIKVVIGYFQNLEKVEQPDKNIEKIKIGTSKNLKDIFCYKIGNGERKIIFMGGMHGNEVGTVKLAHKLINFLQKEKFDEFCFYVIPCLNPDGYNDAVNNPNYAGGGRIGRFNTNNVDLNRNFPTNDFQQKSVWSYGKDYSSKEEVFCGEFGGSEVEIMSLCSFLKNNPVEVLFSFHNAGRDVMGNDNKLSQELIKIYSQETGFKLVTETDWQKLSQTGTAKKWCDENNIAYVEVEGSNRWGSDWKKQKVAIVEVIKFLKYN